MGYDQAAAARVRRVLSDRADIVEKRMVGGISFVLAGRMACGATGDALMVRVTRDGRARALAQPHVRPMELGGRALAGFVLVEPEGYRTDAALAAWVGRALEVAAALATRRPRPRGPADVRPRLD